MNIIELAEQLRSKSEEWGRQRQAIQQEGFWAQRVSELDDTRKGLMEPVGFLYWASGYDGRPTGFDGLESFKRARKRLDDLKKAVVNDPAALVNTPDITQTVQALKEFSIDVEKLATDRWSGIVNAITWDTADLWAAYRGSREHGPTVAQASSLDDQFDRLKKRGYLGKQEDREKFVAIVSEHQEVIALLPPPPDEAIRAFFQSAQVGVPLSQIDDSVMDWLRTQNLLNSFIVRYQR